MATVKELTNFVSTSMGEARGDDHDEQQYPVKRRLGGGEREGIRSKSGESDKSLSLRSDARTPCPSFFSILNDSIKF